MPLFIGAPCELCNYPPMRVESNLEADAARKIGERFGFLDGPREMCHRNPPHIWTQPADKSQPRKFWNLRVQKSLYVAECRDQSSD